MRRGIVRPTAGGEHPVFGALTPGAILDVPDDLWSDDLFLPSADSHRAAATPIEQISIYEALAEIQASQDLLPRIATAKDQLARTLEINRQIEDQLQGLRPVMRKLRIMREELEATTRWIEIQRADQTQQFEAMVAELILTVDTAIRPRLAALQAQLTGLSEAEADTPTDAASLSAPASDTPVPPTDAVHPEGQSGDAPADRKIRRR